MNSIKLQNKMHIIFIIFENSEIFYSHRPLLNFPDKINLKRSDKYFALSNFNIYYTWKNIKWLYKSDI